LTYGGLKAWDANGKMLEVWFAEPGDKESLAIVVDDREAAYPLTIDPVAQEAYVKASNTGLSDIFGYSVAVSGDIVVVGAFGECSSATGVNGNGGNDNAPSSGAAYVYEKIGTVWQQKASLKASNTGGGDRFGHSVAISGETIVVGAIWEDSSATGVNGNGASDQAVDAGAAYVFVRQGGTWSQQAYLKASNTGAGDLFGCDVSISGDIVVVGAYSEDSNSTGVNGSGGNNSASAAGAAYVFKRIGTTWTQQAYLKASNTGANDRFGTSVGVSGDLVIVGADGEASSAKGVNGDQASNSAVNTGAAYIFRQSSDVWSQEAYLKASNSVGGGHFGDKVAIDGATIVIGTLLMDAVYIFVHDGVMWIQ
jgi:trimeric autotransporter adhesin